MLNRFAGATLEAPGKASEAQEATRHYNGARVVNVKEKKQPFIAALKNNPGKQVTLINAQQI